MSAPYMVLLVPTTSHAIRGERVLRKAGLDVKLIPTPRHLSSDCGSALRLPASERSAAVAALEAAGVSIDGIEPLVGD